mmetsp:Transcript_5225/g.9540  ORF Transcript_5225/g.9540 Transcript_5225/m.9540 type:complete len:212 (+) Transcript_5225:1116-1751(+)
MPWSTHLLITSPRTSRLIQERTIPSPTLACGSSTWRTGSTCSRTGRFSWPTSTPRSSASLSTLRPLRPRPPISARTMTASPSSTPRTWMSPCSPPSTCWRISTLPGASTRRPWLPSLPRPTRTLKKCKSRIFLLALGSESERSTSTLRGAFFRGTTSSSIPPSSSWTTTALAEPTTVPTLTPPRSSVTSSLRLLAWPISRTRRAPPRSLTG